MFSCKHDACTRLVLCTLLYIYIYIPKMLKCGVWNETIMRILILDLEAFLIFNS